MSEAIAIFIDHGEKLHAQQPIARKHSMTVLAGAKPFNDSLINTDPLSTLFNRQITQT